MELLRGNRELLSDMDGNVVGLRVGAHGIPGLEDRADNGSLLQAMSATALALHDVLFQHGNDRDSGSLFGKMRKENFRRSGVDFVEDVMTESESRFADAARILHEALNAPGNIRMLRGKMNQVAVRQDTSAIEIVVLGVEAVDLVQSRRCGEGVLRALDREHMTTGAGLTSVDGLESIFVDIGGNIGFNFFLGGYDGRQAILTIQQALGLRKNDRLAIDLPLTTLDGASDYRDALFVQGAIESVAILQNILRDVWGNDNKLGTREIQEHFQRIDFGLDIFDFLSRGTCRGHQRIITLVIGNGLGGTSGSGHLLDLLVDKFLGSRYKQSYTKQLNCQRSR